MKIFDAFKSLFSTYIFEGTAKLIDGKEIRIAGAMDKGTEVFLVTPDAEIPLPDGEWTLDTGEVIVTKDGLIIDVTQIDPNAPVEAPVVEEPVMPDMEEVPVSDEQVQPEPTIDLESRVSEIETKLTELLTKFDELTSKHEAVQAENATLKVDYSALKEEFSSKFERVLVVEPVKQNDTVPINSTNKKTMLGSYDEVYKNK